MVGDKATPNLGGLAIFSTPSGSSHPSFNSVLSEVLMASCVVSFSDPVLKIMWESFLRKIPRRWPPTGDAASTSSMIAKPLVTESNLSLGPHELDKLESAGNLLSCGMHV